MKAIHKIITITVLGLLVICGCMEGQSANESGKKADSASHANYIDNYEPLVRGIDSAANQNGLNIKMHTSMHESLGGENSVHCSNIEYLWHRILEASDNDFEKGGLALELSNSKTWQNSMDTSKLIVSFGHPDYVYTDIVNQYKQKYNIANPDIKKRGNSFWGYSYKLIQFEYHEPFPTLEMRFTEQKVKGFGFTSGNSSIYEKKHFESQFEILYFSYGGEYIIRLKPKETTDRIILFMTNRLDSFESLFTKAEELIAKGKGDKLANPENYKLNAYDELKIPVIKFTTFKEYGELHGLKFSSKFAPIESFQQVVHFDFNESGMTMASTIHASDALKGGSRPKSMVFDRPFYLYIQEENSSYPYFNLWVQDDGILQTSDDSPLR